MPAKKPVKKIPEKTGNIKLPEEIIGQESYASRIRHYKKAFFSDSIALSAKLKFIHSIPGMRSRAKHVFFVPLKSVVENTGADYRLRATAAESLIKLSLGKGKTIVTETALNEFSSKPNLAKHFAEMVINHSMKGFRDVPFLLRLVLEFPSNKIKYEAAELIPFIATPGQMVEAARQIQKKFLSEKIKRQDTAFWNGIYFDLINSAEHKKPGISKNR